jgi:hypothetical protein
MPPEEPKVNSADAGRAWRRANVLGMKKVIKKLQKGYTAEKVSHQLGISLDAVKHVEAIIKVQNSIKEAPLPVDSKVFIDGEEV